MKIWIVSSDPFIKEFERLAGYWDKDEILITPVSKYGFGLISNLKFFGVYSRFKPDTILTDHGYPGFLLIYFFEKLKGKSLNLNVFLRGNYWLEKRLRGEK